MINVSYRTLCAGPGSSEFDEHSTTMELPHVSGLIITFLACCEYTTTYFLGIILNCAEEQLHSGLTVRAITILG